MGDINKQIETIQKEIFDKQQALHKLLKERPLEKVENYNFKDSNGNEHSLSDMFGDKKELLLIHNMGKSCVYCTMWADGMRGYTQMIEDKMAFVLTSPDEHKVMNNFASPRGWNFKLASYHGTSFAHDMGFAYEKEERTWYQPGFSAFIRKDDEIYRTGRDFFGPGDYYCPPWHMFEHFPEGVNNWAPKYKY